MIKRISPVFLVVFLAAVSARADTWKMDGPHSSVNFSVRHLVIAKVHGEFTEFDGNIEFEPNNMENGSVDVTIQTASIDTDNEKRDNHLKSPDFFDVENYPVMTFKSKKITKTEDGKYEMVGDLTIRDVTKEVTLDVEHNGTVKDPWGGTRAGFSAYGNINRQDFGVKWNQALETGGFLVGDEVTINIEAELVKTE